MKSDTDKLLEARERRHLHAVNLSVDLNMPVLILKANMPGMKKNTPESMVILNTMTGLSKSLFDVFREARVESVDGDYHILALRDDIWHLKRVCVYLEETHALGRMMDFDVFLEGEGITRGDLGFARRRCFLCERDAAVCARLGTHDMTEMKAFIVSSVRGFLLEALSEQSEQALLKELYLNPCLSLVGPEGSGIHKDMNISHFLASIEALKPYFRHYLVLGMDLSRHYHTLRKAGLRGEKAMFEATGGVNTHKGAHFIFGLVLPVFMDSVLNHASLDTFKANLKAMAEVLLEDDFKTLKAPFTTGEALYRETGTKGIRGEALRGFPGIFEWYPEKEESGFQKLIRIMARIDDTTLLKRKIDLVGMKKALKSCEMRGFKGLSEVKDTYAHASPGGAADILALVYFLEATDHLLK